MARQRCLILVGFTPSKTLTALRFSNRLASRLSIKHKVLVANSPTIAQDPAIIGKANDWQIVHGSNQLNEISGWQEGLDHLRKSVGEEISAAFINDTVVSHRTFTRFRLSAFVKTILHSQHKGLIGFIDGREFSGFSLDNIPISGWVSTYCFFLSCDALNKLEYKILDLPFVQSCVRGGTNEEEFFSELVSPPLRRHLCKWLFHGQWYASEPLTSSSEEKFIMKAKCIASEKWLAARCTREAIPQLDPFDFCPIYKRIDAETREARNSLRNLLQKMGVLMRRH